jgi:hypothetical protein
MSETSGAVAGFTSTSRSRVSNASRCRRVAAASVSHVLTGRTTMPASAIRPPMMDAVMWGASSLDVSLLVVARRV